MIRFMVLSAPRSASTWVANWLTTERTLCLHDPILEHDAAALDDIPCDRMLGLACTALPLLPQLVNQHPARKIILHRDLDEVNRSLLTIGLSNLKDPWAGALNRLIGIHAYYSDVFVPNRAQRLYEYLLELPFDAARHAQLCAMHVEPNFERLTVKPERARAFRESVDRAFA